MSKLLLLLLVLAFRPIAVIAESESAVAKQIFFYRTNEAWGDFSNFSRHEFRVGGKVWQTVEHFYQAKKFSGTPYEEEIRQAKSAYEAAQMGRCKREGYDKNWDSNRCRIMSEALVHKFTQNQALMKVLLATGDAEIYEHTSTDSYWGDGGDGTGKNMLGQLLMDLRDNLLDGPSFEVFDENGNEWGSLYVTDSDFPWYLGYFSFSPKFPYREDSFIKSPLSLEVMIRQRQCAEIRGPLPLNLWATFSEWRF